MTKCCPTCASNRPHLHPALREEGEVQLCPDEFHAQHTPEQTPDKIAMLARDLPQYYPGREGWWNRQVWREDERN